MSSANASQGQPAPHTGLLDLEKELTCSICTEVLFQPLTLLDCLHTFCGSCLKEWFLWQKAAAKQKRREAIRSSTSSQNIYTCPSCRASVRETRPNATVTTLLDMYLQANPTKAKSEDEKQEIAKHYKIGENVLPVLLSPPPSVTPPASAGQTGRRRREAEAEVVGDRAPVEGVHQISLRELPERGTRVNQNERERDRSGRNRRREEILNISPPSQPSAATRDGQVPRANRSPHPSQQEPDTRQLEHQSSLRSLLSSSDLESQEMEEEIMRQIIEEGLLDGIDLSNINRQEEEEISERIAQAYRRRQNDRVRPRDTTPRPTRRTAERERSLGPPSSYHPDHGARDRRSSSQGSSSSARINHTARSSEESFPRMATRSATDTSDRRETSSAIERGHQRMRSHERRSTEPDPTTARDSPRVSLDAPSDASHSSSMHHHTREVSRSVSLPLRDSDLQRETSEASQSAQNIGVGSVQICQTSLDPESAVIQDLGPPVSTPFLYCSSCSKPRIQHELHYACSQCPPTTGSDISAVCLRCYRTGNSCLNWHGFGQSAWNRYNQQEILNTSLPPQHKLRPEKYLQVSDSDEGANSLSYHLTGVFCDICHNNCNDCYWRCTTCRDGEWGYCRSCVNKARHCTHALVPFSWSPATTGTSALNNPNGTSVFQASDDQVLRLEQLPVHTTCNSCHNTIPPSATRYHCPSCNDGDYDICSSCYSAMVSTRKITRENGYRGWRKCESGHRMLLISFKSRPEGQHRVVVESIVGGWQIRNEDTDIYFDSQLNDATTAREPLTATGVGTQLGGEWSWRDTASGSWKSTRHSATSAQPPSDVSHRKFPPSGGFGAKMTALWTRLPDEGDADELMFPRHALITEVLSINEDWCWGVYCGHGGLFPKAFARIDG